jgi:hypothetical protein
MGFRATFRGGALSSARQLARHPETREDTLGRRRTNDMGRARSQSLAMSTRWLHLACFLIGSSAGAFATGCVANEPVAPTHGIAVNAPPPSPVSEAAPPPSPSAQSVWVTGYWHWNGVQYTWIPGHWENPPPGAMWSAPQYMSQGGGHFYQPGRWSHGPGARNAQSLR